ncbi:MAG: Pr6Pr family membrane protein, partial [Aeromicrobium sp.]
MVSTHALSRLWHSALAVLIVFALLGQIGLVIDGHGRSLINLFSYFTIQSNLLILVASVLIALKPDRDGELFAIFRLAGLVGITLTGIVYSTVLAGTVEFVGAAWWYDKVFHYAVPVGAVLGFLLFQPRTRFARSDVVFV